MQAIFTHGFLTRGWPIWARYAGATLITLVMLALRIGLTEYLPSFPYLLFIPAIIVNAILFNRGTGLYTALLSAALAAYFFVDPIGNLQAGDPRQAIGLVVYLAIGLTTASIIEALHSTLHDLTQANRRLAASEREKDLLLQEAGHRMKNDLAILTSLVKLQERAVQDPAARAALASTADRIQVMSRLHERLKRRDTAAFVNIGSFIEDLCGDLKGALVGPARSCSRSRPRITCCRRSRRSPSG